MTRRRSLDSGFSLVELLVVITIVGVLGGVVVTSIVRSLDVTARATTRVEAITDLQRAIERMSRNIRGADPVVAGTHLSLGIDIYDEVTRRRIVYTAADGALTQTVTTYPTHLAATATSTVTSVVIEGLHLPDEGVFTYARADGTSWTAGGPVSAIGRVQVRLRRQLSDDVVEVVSGTFLRNTLE